MIAPTETSKCYDNTKLSTYKTCPRSYFIRHVLGWRSEGTAVPLVFGLSWHEGMDAVWTYAKQLSRPDLVQAAQAKFLEKWEESGFDPDLSLAAAEVYGQRTPGTAHEMFDNYTTTRWRMLQEAILLACEQPFAVPMPGLFNHWYVGRLDKVVDYNGQVLVLEHKTTTAYATQGNFRSDYVDSWYASSQVKGYEFGAGLYYPTLTAVWVDAALVHKKIHDAFKFIPISHSTTLLTEWVGDAREWIIRVAKEEEAFEEMGSSHLGPGMFPKNEESCFGKYGSCPFLDICRSVADPSRLEEVPVGYVKEIWEPFSILGLDKLVQQTKE